MKARKYFVKKAAFNHAKKIDLNMRDVELKLFEEERFIRCVQIAKYPNSKQLIVIYIHLDLHPPTHT